MYALEHTPRSLGKLRTLSSKVGKFSLRELYALAHTVYRNTAVHGERKEVRGRVRVETGSEMCVIGSEECARGEGKESEWC